MEVGACEYVSVDVLRIPQAHANLSKRKKPFTYIVGQTAGDQRTLQDIAKLVYGDAKAWIQIFEANRNVIAKPGALPYGTAILIPPKKRVY